MLYMGTNQDDCKVIAEIINVYIKEHDGQDNTECFDLTVGGANILDKIECKTLWGYDISPTLIALHQSMMKQDALPPIAFTKELWDSCYNDWKMLRQQASPSRNLESYQEYAKRQGFHDLSVIGACEWYGSFGHGGFSQGAAPMDKRNYYGEARQAHLEQFMITNYSYINFRVSDFGFVNIPPRAIIIAHINSNKNFQWSGKFDKFRFYRWTLTKSKTNPIFIVDDHPLIDIKELKNLKNGKLYFMGNL